MQTQLNTLLDQAIRIQDCIDANIAAESKNDMPLVKRRREQRVKELRGLFCQMMARVGYVRAAMANQA